MAMTECRECKQQVSTQAWTCPHCGAPYPARPKWKGFGFDWKSKTTLFGIPLIHVSVGLDENRRLRVAKGIIAIGQFGVGVITIAQLGVGVLFGLGQIVAGLACVGQFALGYVAIGQLALGYYVLAQLAYGQFVWSTQASQPEAVEFFTGLWRSIRTSLP